MEDNLFVNWFDRKKCQNRLGWSQLVDAVKEGILKADYTQLGQNSLAHSIGQVATGHVWNQFGMRIDPENPTHTRVDQIYKFIELNIKKEMLNFDVIDVDDSFSEIEKVLLRPYEGNEIKEVHWVGQVRYQGVANFIKWRQSHKKWESPKSKTESSNK